jgi:4-hydroxyphenylpyruvate dioxygenase
MKIDCIHFYVEDAIASRDWFANALGFQVLAAGDRDRTRTVVAHSGAIRIALSSPLTSTSPVARYLDSHPPGIAEIAFAVPDLEAVMEKAVANDARVLQSVKSKKGDRGAWKWAKIAAWGALAHGLIERQGETPILPEFPELGLVDEAASQGGGNCQFFTGIDHVVLNVATGELEKALCWYEKVLGFVRQQTFEIQTNRSALSSQVMVHPVSGIQFPINEPASANSQIQEFLDANRGPGIQHIALQTPQIVRAVAQLRQRGLSFLAIPQTYYTLLQQRFGELQLSPAEFEEIAAREILVDWQEDSPQSLLLQIFTQPIFPEPTFFFELIERRQNARGFGEGNFRALFEAIEREQVKRGSLP